MPVTSTADARPPRLVTDERLDFARSTPLRKSYIIASSYRCGSSFLAWKLWATGVLGAPCEYLNPNFEMRTMMKRLKVASPSEYFAKVLACRISRNGVFGMKAHFHHIDAFLQKYPSLLEELSPISYILIDRKDKLAQAVSMAKAYQTNAWTSAMEANTEALQYDRDMIAKCLDEIEQQKLNWRQWFKARDIEPFPVNYEDLTANTDSVVRSIVELLDVEDDRPETVHLPPLEKQGDETNKEWIARFERETQAGADRGRVQAAGGGAASAKDGRREMAEKTGTDFFKRYDRFVTNLAGGASSATGFDKEIRLLSRYQAMIGANRELFRDARVLDIMSADGVWSLAALDAGAAHVVGIEAQPKRAANARNTFAQYGIDPDSYQIINSEIFAALGSFQPEAFDVILCASAFELFDPRLFFRQLNRLRPQHVILDTGVAPGQGPIARFSLRLRDASAPKASGRYASILSTPNHEMIAFMCDYYGFRWRQIDWQAMGLTNWTGIHDYQSGRRQTYVLDRTEGAATAAPPARR